MIAQIKEFITTIPVKKVSVKDLLSFEKNFANLPKNF